MIKVYINNEQIDTNESLSLSLTYAIADIKEPDKKDSTWSKTAYAPGTQFNNKFFGHLWNVNVAVNSSGTTNFNPSFNPNLKANAIITKNDSVVFTGVAQLLDVKIIDNYEIEYEVAFFGELVNLFQTIENRTLDELDLSEYNHLYTAQVQKNSWDYAITKNGASYPFTLGEGYVYPMIDYGYNNGVDWNVRHLFPSVYLKTITDKIFNAAGIQVDSAFMNSERYKRLVIPYNGGSALKLTDTQIANRTFRATSSGVTYINNYGSVTQVIDIADDSIAPNFDNGNNYNNSTSKFTVLKSGTYIFRFKPKVSVTHFPSANTTINGNNPQLGWIRIYKQGVGVMASRQVLLCRTNAVTNSFCVINGGSTVTSGTTTLEYEGELSYTSYAYAGDVIYCDFVNVNTTVYASGSNSASNYQRVNFNVGTLFAAQMGDVNIQEGDEVELSNVLPSKYKQSELLKSVFNAFHLYVQPDPLIPNKLYIEPEPDFYPNTADFIEDWTDKLDNEKEIIIKPLGELNTKRFIHSYKADDDYYNKQYYDEYGETYGEKIFDIENDFLKGEIKNELIFSPTPLVDTLGIDRIIPKIFSIDEQGTVKPKASNIRLLYYGGVKTTNNPYNHIATSGTTILSTYGYAGHVDNPTAPTFDLSFGVPKEVMYLTESYTANNLFNLYWADFYNELSDKNSKIFIGYFKLNELDIKKLNFKCSFYFEGENWRLNKIYDYNPDVNQSVKCEFIKLKTTIPFAQDTGVPIKGGVSNLNILDLAPTNTNRTLSNNSYGIKSFGNFNQMPTTGSGILVSGDNNSVGEGSTNVTILGSSGVTVLGGLSNVTLVNSNNVVVTESNTSYVNGVAVSTTIPKVYKALLTQTGTNAPLAAVLVNTLSGTPVWSYSGVGSYLLTLNGEFITTKTIVAIGHTNNNGGGASGTYVDYETINQSDDYVILNSFDVDLTTQTRASSNDCITILPITIEVYP